MASARFSHGTHSYLLRLEQKDGTATLSAQRDGVEVATARAEVDLRAPWIHLRIDGRTHRTLVVRDGDGVWVTEEGRTWFLKHERAQAATPATSQAQRAELRAPMTGTVIKVLVEPGARVTAGELLAVMEAMKMEYRLEAQTDGLVERVHCRPGDLLNVGALLIQLAAAPGD
jgi:acetyl/propionyl-CoA carboxylase alpha subunit